MATASVIEFISFGGVASNANPLAMPANRCLRSRNWIRTRARYMKLRFGYTEPAMSTVTAVGIHSAIGFERYGGQRFVLFGQGSQIKSLQIGAVGTVTTLATSGSGKVDAFFANNLLYFSNGTDFSFYDGSTTRGVGIPAPTAAQVASATVVENTGSVGSWSATTLTGYQFQMAIYNPTTGHVGNRRAIGSRRVITGTQSVVVISGLPDLTVSTEWVKLLGRTPDGGEVPYALIDANGAFVVAGNTATVATLTLTDVDYNSELPIRNTQPQGSFSNPTGTSFREICFAFGRAYGINPDDPHMVQYSESEFDSAAGRFLGRPEQSWPANNQVSFPTGEAARGIHEVENEVWVWSRNHLAILSELGSYAVDAIPHPYWRGIWVGGIANQRAFAKTPYGPFWVSADKELMTRGESGPLVVSSEYQAGLLAKIADNQVSNIELVYHRDAKREIDRLYVLGTDASGSPVVVVHDFLLRSEQSPLGEGQEFAYAGMTPSTLARSPHGIFSVLDENGVPRLWCGAADGRFKQLENGDSDNGATYSAEYLTILNLGSAKPTLAGAEYNGDPEVQISVSRRLDLTLAEVQGLASKQGELLDAALAQHRVAVEEGAQFLMVRIKLDSHHADGTLEPSDPPHIPLSDYGVIYTARPEIGQGQL